MYLAVRSALFMAQPCAKFFLLQSSSADFLPSRLSSRHHHRHRRGIVLIDNLSVIMYIVQKRLD